MSKHNVVELHNPGSTVKDALTEVLHRGARRLLVTALEVEVEEFVKVYASRRDVLGR